jgi:hypothetical protein
MSWDCNHCGQTHEDIPDCFAIGAPWPDLVPEAEFDDRVQLSFSECIVDEQHFFVRGHIEIPIIDHHESLVFSVWSSLSEKSFIHFFDRSEEPDRETDDPYFGWLSSPIWIYPETRHLKLAVQSRAPGLVPLFILEETDHPLAIDQRNGISIARWHEICHVLLSQLNESRRDNS